MINEPNPAVSSLMYLSDEQRAILVAYRALHRKHARVVGELDHTHQAAANTEDDVQSEGDM